MYNVHSIKKKNFFGTKFFMQSGQLNTNRELEHFSNNKKHISNMCWGEDLISEIHLNPNIHIFDITYII